MRHQIINYELTKELRKLILENPDLPIVVFAGDEVNTGDYRYLTATDISAAVGEICDHPFPRGENIYTDREELSDDLYEYYVNSFDGTEREFNEYIEKKVAEYDPYWRKAIIIFVD